MFVLSHCPTDSLLIHRRIVWLFPPKCTSMFAGVYLTADEIVQYVPAIAAISPEDLNRRLQAENQQLRQEVEQLRRELELCKKLDLSVR